MTTQPQQTSVSNPDYDLVSTLYHSLKSAQTYSTYCQDAKAAGDQDLANFFEQMQQQSDRNANEAKELLAKKVSTSGPH